MPDPILTPEQVARSKSRWLEHEWAVPGMALILCDSHESLRELAGRWQKIAEARDALLVAYRMGSRWAPAWALDYLATPAVQSLIAASKEAADGN